jgi:hypothetical protein
MSDCERLSERMPLVARGVAPWSPEESLHLAGCRSCQEEWELLRLAARLGEAVPRLDPMALSHSVLRRLQRARAEGLRRRTWGLAGLSAAAALLVVIWAERPAPSAVTPAPVARLEIPLPELESLQPEELDSVLQGMDEPLVDGSTLDAPSLGDLDAGELQSVLDYWEG